MFTQTCNDEHIPNDNPTDNSIMLLEDMLNHQTKIPIEWHTSIHEVGQKFDSATEVRLAFLYYSIAKQFEYDFYHNEQRRIRVYCRFKHTHGCPWMLFASPLRNLSIMFIKNFESTHTYGQHGANAGNSRTSRKFIASQIQDILKVRLDLCAVNIKNDMLSNFGIKINYSKAWWGKKSAQQDLFGDDDEAYDSLRCLKISCYGYEFVAKFTALLLYSCKYESMVHATNPGSRVVIDTDDGRFIAGCRSLLFLDGTFIKDRYRGILLSATGYDGNQGIFPLTYCDDDMKELAAIDHRAYVTVMEYYPERWANTYFPGISYDHVTSNVAESFNS
ncbi:uncharacterized protein LOC109826750 [Asparagus officinalis]|uniref:uncharacterized protein LOC109826750 n=1 Tax=Asparagus officinalis TaxID=4686 RepID=UPI00098E5547|nr:uncharacterized protein LOC109826750 [Asparagus officinalis]